jgi:hypothetical protein
MPILVTLFPALLKAHFSKKTRIFDKIYRFLRGGSGPKHSAFCGACFSINPYSIKIGPIMSKIDPKNHEPSVFFNRHFGIFLIKFDPPKVIFLIYRDPIY